MNETIDEPEKERIGEKLIEAYRFWYKRRIWFNLLLGIAGIAGLSTNHWPPFIGVPILFFAGFWGLLSNGLYSLGYSIESALVMQSKGFNDYSSLRTLLFWIGTTLAGIVTFWLPYYILKQLNVASPVFMD